MEVHQHAPGMVDDEEDVEHAERGGGDREEVDRGDALAVVGEKGAPSLPFVGMSRAPGHGARDGALGDLEPELQDLAVDARRTPRRKMWSSTFPDLCEADNYVEPGGSTL